MQLRSLESFHPQDVDNPSMRLGSIMVQLSIHQSYCDLYRIFLTGYAEAAPISAIEGIDSSRMTQMRIACLNHAQSISQLLMDFGRTSASKAPILLDFDAAVCSYHSLRLQLFAACTTGTGSSPRVELELAISNTKDCLEIMTRLFGLLKSVTPMVSLDIFKLLSSLSAHFLLAQGPGKAPSSLYGRRLERNCGERRTIAFKPRC